MTKMEMALLGKEFDTNYYEKYRVEVIETYKYRGEVKTRKTLETTEEGRRLQDILFGEKLFRCPDCGRMVAYGDLEVWDESAETIAADEVSCHLCYEGYMGEDL